MLTFLWLIIISLDYSRQGKWNPGKCFCRCKWKISLQHKIKINLFSTLSLWKKAVNFRPFLRSVGTFANNYFRWNGIFLSRKENKLKFPTKHQSSNLFGAYADLVALNVNANTNDSFFFPLIPGMYDEKLDCSWYLHEMGRNGACESQSLIPIIESYRIFLHSFVHWKCAKKINVKVLEGECYFLSPFDVDETMNKILKQS